MGQFPYTGVIADSAGNLYGTANAGGTARLGVVFKVDTTGHTTVLYNFPGGANGSAPNNLTLDPPGNLYGTTSYGGDMSGCNRTGCGVVYKLDPAGNFTILYTFKGGADGGLPNAGVTRDAAGNLYGTTTGGGSSSCFAGSFGGCGVVYKLDSAGNFTVLHTFTGQPDGGYPNAGVILDAAGNIYGTAQNGGTGFGGIVYKLDPAGNETVLYNFTGGADGGSPDAGVTLDAAGNLYGATLFGGAAFAGVVYKLDTALNETVLYNFSGSPDGANPGAGVIQDLGGNLYGTTQSGGTANAGVVYKIDTSNHETVLHNFTGGADGGFPVVAGVTRDANGNLYGTTAGGGAAGQGTVYRIDTTNHETVLCGFPSPSDGSDPGSLILDAAGNLYGNTALGDQKDSGTIYKVDTRGAETVLYRFTGGTDGGGPQGGLAFDADGNLYGAAAYGGGYSGVVFKLDQAGNQSVLYTFPGFPWPGGAFPSGGVIRDDAGNLYGTAPTGGPPNGCPYCLGSGVVYKLDPSGNQTILYAFTGRNDGGSPSSGLVPDAEGNLYGTTNYGGTAGLGVVYKLDSAGNETVLHDFTGGFDGASPNSAGVIRDPAGNLYGTTTAGGKFNMGVVYKVDTSGIETLLHVFTGGTDGGQPAGGLTRDSTGNLYGTTTIGGTANAGVVFMLGPAGLKVLHNFTGGDDGAQPSAPLIVGDRVLYGTTSLGGKKSGGVVFKLKP